MIERPRYAAEAKNTVFLRFTILIRRKLNSFASFSRHRIQVFTIDKMCFFWYPVHCNWPLRAIGVGQKRKTNKLNGGYHEIGRLKTPKSSPGLPTGSRVCFCDTVFGPQLFLTKNAEM